MTAVVAPVTLRSSPVAARCALDAGKFHQQAVTGGLDDAAVVLGDLRIDELAAQRFEAFERALLVRPHQPRIARHIGGPGSRRDGGSGSCVLAGRQTQSRQVQLVLLGASQIVVDPYGGTERAQSRYGFPGLVEPS